MTKRTALFGLAALVGGGVASHFLGSRPEAAYGDGPLRPCPNVPNCALVRVPLAAGVERAERAAFAAVRSDLGWWLGRLASVEKAPDGLRAEFAVGPFRDRLAVAVEAEGDGSVLWIRSASTVGRSDLGVNRQRARRVAEAVRAEVG